MYNFGRKGRKNKIIFSILVVSIMMIPLLSENEVSANIKIEEKTEIDNHLGSGWIKHFGGTSWAHVVRQTDDGYVLAGATEPDVGFSTGEGLVIKVDNSGDEIWNKTFPNSAFEGLWVTSDNGYIVSGWRTENTNYTGIMIKLYNNGSVEWENTYGDPNCLLIQCQETSDKKYIASGSYEVSGSSDAWLIKIDVDGNEIWNITYGFENSSETFHSIHQTSDNGFILPGWINTGSGSDGWIVKTDADGNKEWENSFDTGQSFLGLDKWDMINHGRQSHDGGYIFTGWCAHTGIAEIGQFWLFKTDASGDLEWEKKHGIFWFHDLGLWVEPTTNDGGYIAAGKRFGRGTMLNVLAGKPGMPKKNQLWVIKTNSRGDILWDFIYRDATARCVQQTSDGGFIIAGHKGPYYDTKGILLIKIDENGNIKKL